MYISSLFSFMWDIFAHLDPDLDNPNVDPNPADQNQCGSMRILIHIQNYNTWFNIVPLVLGLKYSSTVLDSSNDRRIIL